MGEALTPVMENYPKFITTQIDNTWRRFEILFADMKQDSTNSGRQSPGKHARRLSDHRHGDPGQHRPPTPTNWELWLDDVGFIK